MAFTSLIVVAILILILALLCGCVSYIAEPFATNTNVNYVDDNIFAKAITVSPFFRNLTSIDLIARNNALSQEEYAKTYFASKIAFTEKDKYILDECVSRANDLLKDFPKIQQAPWNFAKVQLPIENGYPHTIANIIVLNERVLAYPLKDLTKTLIHEKIHVIQRTYPLDFMRLYDKIGFKKTREMTRHPLARANPDIDNNLYMYKSTHQVPMQLYKSQYPNSIADSLAVLVMPNGETETANARALGLPEDVNCQLEHPNEIVACLMSEMLTNPNMQAESYIKQYNVLSTIMVWMVQNWK